MDLVPGTESLLTRVPHQFSTCDICSHMASVEGKAGDDGSSFLSSKAPTLDIESEAESAAAHCNHGCQLFLSIGNLDSWIGSSPSSTF